MPILHFSLLQFISLAFKHTIFCSKLPEIVEVEILINLSAKCCKYKELYILHEMRRSLKCYWNLPELDRDQDTDV